MTVREVPAKTDPAIPGPPRGRISIDVAALKRRLRSEVSGEVRFDPGTLAMYANDASNYRQVPIGVVVPKTLDDVVAAHRVCHRFGAPVLNRGGGTSLSGETVNYAVVIDHSKYLTGVGKIDAKRRLVTCEPGVINEELNRHTGEHGLVFGPDPSSHSRCVIGGNIGNNSCGIHSVQAQLYGPGPRTSDNVHALEVVTYDGTRFWVGNGEEDRLDEIIAKGDRKGQVYAALRDLRDRYADQIRARYPSVTQLPRRVSGYNLDELLPEKGFNVARALTGTESTCVTVLRATLMLTPALLERTLVVVGYPELADAAEHCMEIIERWRPIGLEALDEELIEEQQQQHKHVDDIAELPRDGSRAWLLVQFGADTAQDSEDTARRFAEWLTRKKRYDPGRIVIAESKQEGGWSQDIWEIREGGLGSTAFARGEDNWPGWEDSAVPPDKLGGYVVDLRELMNRHGLKGAMYGHFGQGCIHCRLSFDLRTAGGLANYRTFMEEAADLVTDLRRHAVRGAWRRPAARRAAGKAVRTGAGPGDAGVQADLGPGLEDEPGQGRRPVPDGREPQARHGVQSAAARDQVRLPRGQRRLRARHAALRGGRQVPRPAGLPHHVPELPGDPGGEAQHQGPGAAAVRDAPGRSHHGRLGVTGGLRRARLVPGVQGLHQRLPGRRGHAHL